MPERLRGEWQSKEEKDVEKEENMKQEVDEEEEGD